MSKTQKLLIAEDEDVNFLLFKIIMEKEGFDVLRASNGQEALDLFKGTPDIDLILMDIKMPVMDGLTASHEIRKLSTTIPIIAVTAYAELNDYKKCISAGCNSFHTKPVDRAKLIKDIRLHLIDPI